MQDKMFTAFNEQSRSFFEPMRKLNTLMLDNMEKMTQYQLESMKRYSQLGTERLRDASEIDSAEDLRDFGSRQAEVLNELSKQMLEDARAMTELSLQFKSEMEQLFAEAGEQAADKTESTAKSAEPAKATSQSSRNSGQSSGSKSSS
ncbi:phasin family protein [Aidingimonas lacisalsi]|uniref:phasin family protein n=1 Tax=Aidingimonas lacisalsi TaxID=2604086 RepID=UPI0011D1AF26|nr:phasin family protein [Aidingimonas lacisalsi]